MNTTKKFILQLACCGILFSTGIVTSSVAQDVTSQNMTGTDKAASSAGNPGRAVLSELPDSPGTTFSSGRPAASSTIQLLAQQSQPSVPEPATQPSPQAAPQNDQPTPQPQAQTSTGSQSSADKPVGTAAAGFIPTTGVAASQPAGVAIAPAKQHRMRTIVIRTGAIIGAGVAIGTVAALSEGTSSKPPGAH